MLKTSTLKKINIILKEENKKMCSDTFQILECSTTFFYPRKDENGDIKYNLDGSPQLQSHSKWASKKSGAASSRRQRKLAKNG